MTLNQFIRSTELKQADAIMLKNHNPGIMDRYFIYLGLRREHHQFIGNFVGGPMILTGKEFLQYSGSFSRNDIRRFKGNAVQRTTAADRAWNRCDETSFHLIRNNCVVSSKYTRSSQNQPAQNVIFGTGLTIAGIAAAATAKNDLVRVTGFAMAALGLVTLLIDDDN